MIRELPYDELPYDTPLCKLSPLQAKVAIALAHGGTLTGVANSCGIHRVTICRWMKSLRPLETAVEQECAEYARARVAMFILQRNDSLKRGWALPVNLAPLEDRNMEPDSPLIAEDERRIRALEAQMATPEPAPAASDATPCNGMQRGAANSEPGPAPRPLPPAPRRPETATAPGATPCNEIGFSPTRLEGSENHGRF
jgi:hypothetical protein